MLRTPKHYVIMFVVMLKQGMYEKVVSYILLFFNNIHLCC